MTSFEKGVNRFTWLMIKFMLVMVPLVFLINGVTKHNWMEAFIFAMSVAVGLTPEMLPMIVTVNLSKGALAMSRKKVIVKRLNSIQNFGAMDVLCTDKTGTLTQDKVIMKRHIDLNGEDCDDVLQYAYLNSFYQSGLKNLLDIAVLNQVDVRQDLHIDEQAYSKVDEIPFDFVRRRCRSSSARTKRTSISSSARAQSRKSSTSAPRANSAASLSNDASPSRRDAEAGAGHERRRFPRHRRRA